MALAMKFKQPISVQPSLDGEIGEGAPKEKGRFFKGAPERYGPMREWFAWWHTFCSLRLF